MDGLSSRSSVMPQLLNCAALLRGSSSLAGISTVNFQGCVPNELEAIFRRGSEWEAGVELVVALALQASRWLCPTRQGWFGSLHSSTDE